MASIEIRRDELIVHIHGWNKVLAMRGTVRVPMSHVRAARVRPQEANFDDVIVESWRGVGTYVPHKVAAGLVYLKDGASFYDVRNPALAIAVDVERENVRHLVIEIDDETPEEAVRKIEAAIGAKGRNGAVSAGAGPCLASAEAVVLDVSTRARRASHAIVRI